MFTPENKTYLDRFILYNNTKYLFHGFHCRNFISYFFVYPKYETIDEYVCVYFIVNYDQV